MVEAHQQHGPNITIFHLKMGGPRWQVVGCYLATRNASTVERVAVPINHGPIGAELLVADDFNTYLESTDGNEHDKTIMAEMKIEGLDDMTKHLLPCKLPWTRYGRVWIILHCKHEVRSRMD